MDDLIEALTVMRKYESPQRPTSFERDACTGETVLLVHVDPRRVSPADLYRLEQLHFVPSGGESFVSSYFAEA